MQGKHNTPAGQGSGPRLEENTSVLVAPRRKDPTLSITLLRAQRTSKLRTMFVKYHSNESTKTRTIIESVLS